MRLKFLSVTPPKHTSCPLFFALAATGWGQGGSRPTVDYISREITYGALAMDALALH